MKFQAPRGTEDVLPDRSRHWQWAESEFRAVAKIFNYAEIRTPTFEDTSLFLRMGEGTDVVSKEMYTFADKGGRSITLKPEGTAGAVRAYIEGNLGGQGQITKLFYITPIFRYERPQKGRLRESHQTGFELIGSSQPDADAEIIEATVRFYERLGLTGLVVKVNSLGNDECRAAYRNALLEFATALLRDMSNEEARAKYERNPLRMLDSKDEEIQAALRGAPKLSQFLESDSQEHFDAVRSRLDALEVAYEVDERLVRGLDYYTRTVFEVHSSALGAQSALCGGGRYDNLIEECGGAPTPAVGVAMGIERALMAAESAGSLPSNATPPEVFAVCLTEKRNEFAKIVAELRSAGISVDTDLEFRSAKSQFRQADKCGARIALTIGDDELAAGTAKAKRLSDGSEHEAALNGIAQPIRALLE
jgi:histidyl-tRNA synthetase